MPEPFLPPTPELDVAEWRALGVLACETRLNAHGLEAVAPSVSPEFWRACVEKGWLVDAGAAVLVGSTR